MDALRNKRLKLVGLMSRLEQQWAQHRGSLTQLDAAVRLFDPDMLSHDAGPATEAGFVIPSR